MQKVVKRVEFRAMPQPHFKRVAAYARVSSGKDAMRQSLSAQISYYSSVIQNHTGWQFTGVYADEAITGTRENRPQFQRLLNDCRSGKIDLIITKSISRFARNTVTLLQTVRELKDLGVDVLFEEQNIHTLSKDGELMLTILASYAQEESRSVSENQKWRVRRNFESGIPWNGTLLGYRICDGQYIVIEDEAAIVKRIFQEYLEGKGTLGIAKELNEERIPTRLGHEWTHATIKKMLSNINYTGNLLLQKTYRENFITKKKMTNNGEKAKFYAKQTHEPIISTEMFEAVQKEQQKRAEKYKPRCEQKMYPFSSKLICSGCGKHYKRRKTSTGYAWICSTFNTNGKKECPTSKQIPEERLEWASAEALGSDKYDPTQFNEKVDYINVGPNNMLEFILKDGVRKTVFWKERSRSESWTPEKRALARQKRLSEREAK